MWAWSHAAIATPDGLEVPDGTYISWMNDRHLNLLDADAVEFVATELDLAERDANEMTRVGGPLIVFDHDRIAGVHSEHPARVVGEHVEDAVALLLKWGVPVLGATSAAWVDAVDARDGVIAQLGVDTQVRSIAVGRADAVSATVLGAAGGRSTGATRPPGYRREELADDATTRPAWVFLAGDAEVTTRSAAAVLARADGWPTATSADHHAWWQPPELADPTNPLLPRSQYGSVASAVRVAHWWNNHDAEVRVAPVLEHLPVTVQWWDNGDRRTILVGNLESGWLGDSRTSRTVTVSTGHGENRATLTIDVRPEGCTVQHLGAPAITEAPTP
jgi:hypothetical protein